MGRFYALTRKLGETKRNWGSSRPARSWQVCLKLGIKTVFADLDSEYYTLKIICDRLNTSRPLLQCLRMIKNTYGGVLLLVFLGGYHSVADY